MHAMTGADDPQQGSSGVSYSSTDSYHHCKDIRYPVCNLTLPEVYGRHKTLAAENGVTWHRPFYRLTYRQLYQQAQQIARGLLSLGLKKGDVVLSLGSQCPDSVLMFVAGSLIGLVFSAPYLSNPFEKNIAYRLKKMKPKAIVFGSSFSGYHNEPVGPYVFKTLADLGDSQEYIHLFADQEYLEWEADAKQYSSQSAKGCSSFGKLKDMGSAVSEQQLKKCMATMTPMQPCFIASSSGSTGEPKLIVHRARFLSNCAVIHEERGTRGISMVYGTGDMCTEDMALLDSLISGFYIGFELVILPRINSWDMDKLHVSYLEAFHQHKINMCYGEQCILAHIVNHPECMDGYDVSNLKALEISNSGSSPAFKARLLESFPDSIDVYGQTESWYVSFARLGEMKRSQKVQKVGPPVVNIEVKIVDEKGSCVPRNERGELWVRSCLVMIEYLGQPELTKDTVTSDGWLKSGDCAIMDDDNDLQIVGRMTNSERFNVYGDVVYAQAVEFHMKKMTEIGAIIVVGRDLGKEEDCELTYCIQLKKDETLSGEQIFEYAKQNLLSHNMWPVRVMFFDDFPRIGGRNKITRAGLLEEVKKRVEKNINEAIVNPDYLTE